MSTPPGIDPAVYAQALADVQALRDLTPIATPDQPTPPTARAGCGTQAGYQWHHRHGERACDRCLHANNVASARRGMRRATGDAR